MEKNKWGRFHHLFFSTGLLLQVRLLLSKGLLYLVLGLLLGLLLQYEVHSRLGCETKCDVSSSTFVGA